MSIKVLLVDDHKVLCEGLCALLEKEPDIQIVGEAVDGEAAIELVRRKAPDVVVMDVSLPGISGVDATRQILAECTRVKVLCLSMHTEGRYVLSMLGAGASGYIPKDSASEELVRAVRAVAANQVYLSPLIAAHVVAECVTHDQQTQAQSLAGLTNRECEIVRLIAEGESTREIAKRLHVSVKTIASHRKNLMAKLNTQSIAVLTKFALREGLVSAE